MITKIEAIQEQNGGTLPSFAFPGGYPLYYISWRDAVTMCPECANDPPLGTVVEDYSINWEDPAFYCDICSKQIASAYADDDDKGGEEEEEEEGEDI